MLSKMKQERLASREELKAVAHIAEQVGFSLDHLMPAIPYRAQIPGEECRLKTEQGGKTRHYLWNTKTGQASWDSPGLAMNNHLRLCLSADEGGPLQAAAQYLSSKGAAVLLRRDDLVPARNRCAVFCIFRRVTPMTLISLNPRHKLSNHFNRVMHCTPMIHRTLALDYDFTAAPAFQKYSLNVFEARQCTSLPRFRT